MSSRTRGKKHLAQKTQIDAATQTSPDKNLLKINRVKEENHLLLEEVRQLRQKLQANSVPQKQSEERTVVAVADSPQQQQIPGKGCSCRGKCSSRVCGCVKKQVACTVACKCTHVKCVNKGHNKENVARPNAQARTITELENSTKLMSALKLAKNIAEQDAEGAAGPSHNQLEPTGVSRQSIFSPGTPEIRKNGQPVSNVRFISPIRFDSSTSKPDGNSQSSNDIDQTPVRNVREDLLKVAPREIAYGKKKADASQSKKKKLISPYYDGRKRRAAAQDIEGMNSPVREKPVERREKKKNVEQVLRETATSSSGNLVENEQFESETINPMKPTRQLQRTPVSASPKRTQLRRSESPFPYQEIKLEKRSIPPPQDIDEPHVNWDEHVAQLVPCKHCSRTFYPFRLEKHESSCKRI